MHYVDGVFYINIHNVINTDTQVEVSDVLSGVPVPDSNCYG